MASRLPGSIENTNEWFKSQRWSTATRLHGTSSSISAAQTQICDSASGGHSVMLLEPLLRIRLPKRGARDPNVEGMTPLDPSRPKRAPFLAAALSHRNFLDVSSA